MTKSPNLEKIIERMEKGEDFRLTQDQYSKLTGRTIPKNKHYAEKRSAVAHEASNHGYTVTKIPEQLVFTKIQND